MSILDRNGSPPFLFLLACQYNSPEIIKYMIDFDAALMNVRDKRGNSPLHKACRGGNFKAVPYLLEKQMSLVTETNIDGDLPIHLASDELKSIYRHPEYQTRIIEIVCCLLLAYPDCLSCVGERTSGSDGKDFDNKKNR